MVLFFFISFKITHTVYLIVLILICFCNLYMTILARDREQFHIKNENVNNMHVNPFNISWYKHVVAVMELQSWFFHFTYYSTFEPSDRTPSEMVCKKYVVHGTLVDLMLLSLDACSAYRVGFSLASVIILQHLYYSQLQML